MVTTLNPAYIYIIYGHYSEPGIYIYNMVTTLNPARIYGQKKKEQNENKLGQKKWGQPEGCPQFLSM